MGVPGYVKIVVAVTSLVFLAVGTQKIVAPGAPLPTGDAALPAFTFGGAVPPLPANYEFISHFMGFSLIATTLPKVVAVFGNASEGTFLRRDFFLICGLLNFFGMAILAMNEPAAAAAGATFVPFMGLYGVEGLVLVGDALLRKRAVKKQKRSE
uniref:Uncharacterized protein n=1 Tax=Phaeomonas parva TaxID=124430 RepID=A0A7S1UBV0_9STRA|mmetsp:Transcript_37911/g.118847  ORF Transcript_37911/g.118847 Transcript_37911/m.118847 type:complete len:154 (+) Transcript_37911:122-583(+)|eukprot:CAMPEP_0118868184 /NCGR_PEP_ID=MMETSP1163-20130328/11642_1 /TAXON_ID=124430 /ORGANISM="Phaeomonas parva, Strain CCMP2877" /LENGTH=153 /DNA_ID=CAMNT_0006802779 /DNA_START=118 /DNA_END=579 /DNA_ORIENTATION=+